MTTPAAATGRWGARALREQLPQAASVDWPALARPALVLLQAATIVLTWELWQARTSPPPLPVVDVLPQIDLGWLLLGTLALTLFRPTMGALAHLVVLLVAVLLDQTRLQPEVVSMALILLGTTTLAYARVIARAHLVSLWLWAGLNKALSLGFMSSSAPWLYNAFPLHVGFVKPYFGWIIIVAEISIGVLLLIPRLRVAGVVVAVALHLMGLVALVSIRWNESVWPWNLALALAAPAFFLFRDKVSDKTAPRNKRLAAVLAVAIGILPAGFYAGVVDAYLAHNLYTSNTARAVICRPGPVCTQREFQATWDELNVPLPPEPRLYRDYFRLVCTPDERLIVYPRQTRIIFGLDAGVSQERCPL